MLAFRSIMLNMLYSLYNKYCMNKDVRGRVLWDRQSIIIIFGKNHKLRDMSVEMKRGMQTGIIPRTRM